MELGEEGVCTQRMNKSLRPRRREGRGNIIRNGKETQSPKDKSQTSFNVRDGISFGHGISERGRYVHA